jgi:phosphocarrier protein FPr
VTGPVGLVAVSHSRALAEAAVALAREMAAPDQPIEVAAGTDDGGFGTDAAAIAAAIGAADRGAGVVVLMDLGSAVLSAELARELVDDPERVLLCPAPFVEGLVVAAVAAAGGADRAAVAAQAAEALRAKAEQLGAPDPAPPDPEEAGPDETDAEETARGEFVVADPQGLHARPASRLVAAVQALDGVRVQLRNATTGSGPVPGDSLMGLLTLGVLAGHRIEVEAAGPAAEGAVRAVLDAAPG